MSAIDWPVVLAAGAEIVESYDTSVTLRQLHYRLVSRPELGYPNTQNAYKALSSRTAEARRRQEFPRLHDRTRSIYQRSSCASPKEALMIAAYGYSRDHTEGQDVSVYVGVEKAGLVAQLSRWFYDLGLPVLALGGYSSQSFADDVVASVVGKRRPAVLIYAGDFDASGEDIDRDFVARTDCWAHVERVALSAALVERFNLPPAPGKAADSRSGAFIARHGQLVQVELDALDPADLRRLYSDAIDKWVDKSVMAAVIAQELAERDQLKAVQL